MDIIIEELVWKQWNIEHMWERHTVTPEEVLESLNDGFLIVQPAKEGRVMILGRAGKRLLATIINQQKLKKDYVKSQ